MNVSVRAGVALTEATDLAVVAVAQGDALPDSIAQLMNPADFSGKVEETALLYPRGAVEPKRVLLVGLGEPEKITADTFRRVGAVATKRASALKVDSFHFSVVYELASGAIQYFQALAEGMVLGSYRFDQYKTDLKDEDRFLTREATLLVDELHLPAAEMGVDVGSAVVRGTMLARDLVNSPGAVITPETLAAEAQKIGDRHGFRVAVYEMDALREQGFGGVIAVGQGSVNEPRFIVMEYGQKTEGIPTVCLVGKGLTFDSGGLNIKTGDYMAEMKQDMGGAGAVLGTMEVVADLRLPIHLVGLIPAAENMPSGSSYRPGDIIKTLSGKTVEVLNTDAEGRIILADGLHYAHRFEPDAIIDLATLTGAVMVALGTHATGLMGTSPELVSALRNASEVTGERAWELPLWDEYREMVKSEVADVKNVAGRDGGAITAGAFLATFAGDYPWAHLDIAGTAWTDKVAKAYDSKGGTGVGVRLLVEYIRELAAER